MHNSRAAAGRWLNELSLLRAAGALLALVVPATLLFGALAPKTMIAEVASGGISCVFLAVTGVPCPFCGMTRATLALGQGDFGGAFGFHPLAPLVLLMTFGVAVFLARGKAPVAFGRKIGPPAVLATVGLIWLVNIVA